MMKSNNGIINKNPAIVVLNYLNYEDTIECVDSILQMDYKISGIVVVDNGSDNESYEIIKMRYAKNIKVFLVGSKKNVGYARGNNIGIKYARNHLHTDFILVVNNDTVFIDKDYISKLIAEYREGIGVIGSKIKLKNGLYQRQYFELVDLKSLILSYINEYTYIKGSSFDFPLGDGCLAPMIHGSALLFTPSFFKCYKGFFPHTFLYGEEAILYFMCRCKKLEQKYIDEAVIFHKEDMSSDMSFKNDRKIKIKYSLTSKRYIILWCLRFKLINALMDNNN